MYVYTQNITQGSAASGGADPADRKGHCESRDASFLYRSRRPDPLCSRLSNLYDHKTGLESDLPSGLDRSRYHGHYDRDRRHREPDCVLPR